MSRVFWWLPSVLMSACAAVLGVAMLVEDRPWWQAILCLGLAVHILHSQQTERLAYQAGWARGVYESHDLATLGVRRPEPWDPPPAPPPGWSPDEGS